MYIYVSLYFVLHTDVSSAPYTITPYKRKRSATTLDETSQAKKPFRSLSNTRTIVNQRDNDDGVLYCDHSSVMVFNMCESVEQREEQDINEGQDEEDEREKIKLLGKRKNKTSTDNNPQKRKKGIHWNWANTVGLYI